MEFSNPESLPGGTPGAETSADLQPSKVPAGPGGSPDQPPEPVAPIPTWPVRAGPADPSEPAGGPWYRSSPRRPRMGLGVALAVVLVIAFAAGVAVDRAAFVSTAASGSGDTSGAGAGGSVVLPSTPPGLPAQFKTFLEAWQIIQQNYVDRAALDPAKLTYGSVRGLVDALGDTGHSRFLAPAEIAASHSDLSGTITGIGARMAQQGSTFIVQSVVPGSPAEKAGLRAGDTVLAVDGKPVDHMTLDAVVQSIRGDVNTTVRLTIGRVGQADPFDVSIVRAKINVPAVSWAIVPGTTVADVRIEEFSKGVTDDLKKVLIDAQNAHATAVVLDLRDDPGGYVDEAIGVASVFMKDATVYEERDASGQTKAIPTRPGERATDLPTAVLINQGSASAAEIVAGGFLDNQRAKLFGQKTFGTGTVLREFDLTDGSALLLGTVEWLTPKGQQIWHQGISPTVEVAIPASGHVVVPTQFATLGASGIASQNDAQLAAAVASLPGGK